MGDVLHPRDLAEKLRIRLAATPVQQRIGQVMGEFSDRYGAKHGDDCKSREVIVLCQGASLAISLPLKLPSDVWTEQTTSMTWLNMVEDEIKRLDIAVERMIVCEKGTYERVPT